MTGLEIYNTKTQDKIDAIIMKNNNKAYLNGFYNYMSNVSFSTGYVYLKYVINFMDYANKEPRELKLDDYTSYLATLKYKTSSYQISVYSALKKFSLYLRVSGLNLDNSMQYVNRPKFKETPKTKEKREAGYLDQEEIGVYINSVKNGVGGEKSKKIHETWGDRDIAMISIFLSTGIRCSALYKLDIDSIDLNNKTLTTVDKGSQVAIYNLPDEVINYIVTWINKRSKLVRDQNENALFISTRGTRLSNRAISQVVTKYAQGIEGKHISPHKLRATYGTQLLNETRDIYFVQKCMGHSSPATTELYIRGQDNTQRSKASNIMGKVIFKNS